MAAKRLRQLLPSLTGANVKKSFSSRGEKRCQVVGSAGELTIMSAMTKQADGLYFNPTTKTCFRVTYDEEGRAATAQEGTGPEQSELAQAVQKELDAYLKNQYAVSEGAVVAGAVMDGEDGIQILISAERLNLNNYWGGSWVNSYTFAGGVIKGEIKVSCHYFESGNVMLNSNKVVNYPEVKDSAEDIVKAIGEIEQEYQKSLTKWLMDDCSERSVGHIRRGLTIQGQKFDWRVEIHKATGQLSMK